MQRILMTGLVAIAIGSLTVRADAQVVSTETGAAEASRTVTTAAQYRTALTELSAVSSGTNTLVVGADITLTADNEPTYTGTRPLIIRGQGHTIDGNDLNRALDATGSTAAITIRNITITEGSASGGAGGAVAATGPLTVSGSTFSDNEALGDAGGALWTTGALTISTSTFDGNRATYGGAALAYANDITVSDTTFDGNVASSGGALRAETFFTGGDVTILDSTFTANRATTFSAGAVQALNASVTGSTFVDNEADVAGGAIDARVTEASNSTFVDNLAPVGSTIAGSALNPTIALDHVTMTTTGGSGNGQMGLGPGGTGALTLTSRASVLAADAIADCAGVASTVSQGHNVESSTTCDFDGATDAQNVADPGLGPVRQNSGTTPTLFPLAGSPLVDAIPSGDCPLAVDQQGVDRPFGAGCDIGAVEQVYPDHPFTDVPGWVEDTVRWIGSTVNDPQIMTGITATTFEPDDPITRAQVTRLLYNEAGAPDAGLYPAHPFTDVPAWVEDAVRWAYGEGLITGITPTTFAPDDPITRAQVTRMKYRFAGSPGVSGLDPHPFTDVPPWVEDAVRWAANPDNPLPLVTGITPTTFVPNDPITRAQVARMDYRLALTPGAWAVPGDAPYQMLFRDNLS